MQSIGTKVPGEKGYVSDAKLIVSKKIHGPRASHAGFQMAAYLKAINNLIQRGVRLTNIFFFGSNI
jgi:hypothetical protein